EQATQANDHPAAAGDAFTLAISRKRWQQNHGGNQHAVEGRSRAGNVGPANEDRRPSDAHDAEDERQIGGHAASGSGLLGHDGSVSSHESFLSLSLVSAVSHT